MIWHSNSLENVIKELNTDADVGLSESEAIQRLSRFGRNEINYSFRLMPRQFVEKLHFILSVLLLALSAIHIAFCIVTKKDITVAVISFVIVALTFAAIYLRKRLALKAVKKSLKPESFKAKVKRDGKIIAVDGRDIVPGDILVLSKGDLVLADARIIECNSFRCDEFPITGIGYPANKDAAASVAGNSPLSKRTNMVFSGCRVEGGSALAVVTETGMNTEIARITAKSRSNDFLKDILGPLFVFCSRLGIAAVVAGAIFLLASIIMTPRTLLENLLLSGALCYVAVAYGVPTAVISLFAHGLKKMKNIKLCNLQAIVKLSRASVICTDMPFLAQDRMRAACVFLGRSIISLSKKNETHEQGIRALLRLAALNCNKLSPQEEQFNPIEEAIIQSAKEYGIDKGELDLEYPRLSFLPYSDESKVATSVNLIDGKVFAIISGDIEQVLARCDGCNNDFINENFNKMAFAGLKVVAIAYRQLPESETDPKNDETENGFTFAGLIGIYVYPQKGAKGAVETFKQAGMRTILITGENPVFAAAFTRKINILFHDHQAIDCKKLSDMSDEQLSDCVRNCTVFAGASKSDEKRIIGALQKAGEVVVADVGESQSIYASRQADVGYASLSRSSDVTRAYCDMLVKDDSLNSIASATIQCRGIFAKVKSIARFLLCFNIAVVALFAADMLLLRQSILTAVQALLLGLIINVIALTAMCVQNPRQKTIQSPRGADKPLFTPRYFLIIILSGLFFAAVSIAAFILFKGSDPQLAGSLAFAVLYLALIFYSFDIQAVLPKTVNWLYICEFIAFIVLLFIIMFIEPLKAIFGFPEMNGSLFKLIVLSATPALAGKVILFFEDRLT